MEVIRFMPQLFCPPVKEPPVSIGEGLGEPQSRPGCCGKQKNLCPSQPSNPSHPVHSPFTILAELSILSLWRLHRIMCCVLVSLVGTAFWGSRTFHSWWRRLQFEAMARRHKENIPNLQKTHLLSTREMKVNITYVHLWHVITVSQIKY